MYVWWMESSFSWNWINCFRVDLWQRQRFVWHWRIARMTLSINVTAQMKLWVKRLSTQSHWKSCVSSFFSITCDCNCNLCSPTERETPQRHSWPDNTRPGNVVSSIQIEFCLVSCLYFVRFNSDNNGYTHYTLYSIHSLYTVSGKIRRQGEDWPRPSDAEDGAIPSYHPWLLSWY